MLDYLDDIESDLSAFHRVDDPMSLDSPRYFRLAARLMHYNGALKASLLARVQEDSPNVAEHTPEQLAGMTDGPDQFPGIEYAG